MSMSPGEEQERQIMSKQLQGCMIHKKMENESARAQLTLPDWLPPNVLCSCGPWTLHILVPLLQSALHPHPSHYPPTAGLVTTVYPSSLSWNMSLGKPYYFHKKMRTEITTIIIMKIYWPISTCQAFTNESTHIISCNTHKNPRDNGHVSYEATQN